MCKTRGKLCGKPTFRAIICVKYATFNDLWKMCQICHIHKQLYKYNSRLDKIFSNHLITGALGFLLGGEPKPVRPFNQKELI